MSKFTISFLMNSQKIPSFNRSVFFGKLLNSIDMFPDDKLLMNFTKEFN